jgi:hypothetical protein
MGSRTPTTGGLLQADNRVTAVRIDSVFARDVRDFTAQPPSRIGTPMDIIQNPVLRVRKRWNSERQVGGEAVGYALCAMNLFRSFEEHGTHLNGQSP